MSTCFLLGSGASVDSGLFTYRGKNGIYNNLDYEEILSYKNYLKNPEIFWNHFSELHESILKVETPGNTYLKIKDLITSNSFIFTQNIDKLAETCTNDCVNLHGSYDKVICSKYCNFTDFSKNYINKKQDIKTLICPNCSKGIIRPNFTMYGENLSLIVQDKIYKYIKRRPKYLIITGTTLQFSYLIDIIHKLKSKGTIVIHIDPDINFLLEIKKKCKRRYYSKIFICAESYAGLCYAENIIKENMHGDTMGNIIIL